jgi:hypothetical protein
VRAPVERVFAAISGDAASWSEWFPGVSAGGQDGVPALGTHRWVKVQGTRYDETVIVWEEPTRWAFRVDATNVPMAKALVEQWTMRADGDATAVRWTFAMEPALFFKVTGAFAPVIMGRLFRRAMRNLEERLR